MLETLTIVDVRFGDTLPDFGPNRTICAISNNRDENDPEGTIFLEKLLASTSRTGTEMTVMMPWSGNRIVDGWFGRVLHFFPVRHASEDTTFRFSNCPNLLRICFCGYKTRFTGAFISHLPQLEHLSADCLNHLKHENEMPSLTNIRIESDPKTYGTIEGLENCSSLHYLELKRYHLSDLRTVSGNSEIKAIDVSFSSLSGLVGVEYLHNLEYLKIRRTPLAREIQRKLRRIEEEKSGEEDALSGLLCQLNMKKVRIMTGLGWVEQQLAEFVSRASN